MMLSMKTNFEYLNCNINKVFIYCSNEIVSICPLSIPISPHYLPILIETNSFHIATLNKLKSREPAPTILFF